MKKYRQLSFVLFFCMLLPVSAAARITREDFAFLNTYRIVESDVKTVEESAYQWQEGRGTEQPLQQSINTSLGKAFDYIISRQSPDGSWKDVVDSATHYTAYYIILMQYLERVDPVRQGKAAQYILSCQDADGTWASFPGGPADASLTLMNYFALKLAGIDPSLSPMINARYFLENNLTLGGIAGWDLFILVFMGQLPLKIIAGPYPKELIFLPDMLPNIKDLPTVPRIAVIPALLLVQQESVFNAAGAPDLSDLSLFRNLKDQYAGSTILDSSPALSNSGLAQLMRAMSLLAREAALIRDMGMQESVRLRPCNYVTSLIPDAGPHEAEFLTPVGAIAKREPPPAWRRYTPDFLSADHRLFELIKNIPEKSGLFYANSLLTVFYLAALKAIDTASHPAISRIEIEGLIARGLLGLDDLAVETDEHLFMPLVKSDMWDTASLLGHLQAYNPQGRNIDAALTGGIIFLLDRQSHIVSDWKRHNVFGVPGGWGFEDHDERRPDPDDTSLVLKVLRPHILTDPVIRRSFQRGANWLLSMRNDDGGFPMFERQGDGIYNLTPYVAELSPVDAMYDESLLEMSARIATVMLTDLGFSAADYEIRKIAQLIDESRRGNTFESIWFTNYIFATASVNRFRALAGEDVTADEFLQTNAWINDLQHDDGGWGESPASFYSGTYVDFPLSSPLITSAVISSKIDQLLHSNLAQYESEMPVIIKGLAYLVASQNGDGYWEEPTFVNSYIPKEKMHCNYGLATKLAPYEGLLSGLKFLNSLAAP